jgi:thioredoxin-like negative regulator of GroEL
MEIHYIGATWCKACHTVKPTVKKITEQAKVLFVEHDYDTLSEAEQAKIGKLPTIYVKENKLIQVEFMTATAADSLKLYLQSKKLLPEEEF